MDPKTRVVAVAGSLGILLLVIELVRRRRLKEEYSLLWVLIAVALLVLSIWYGLLLRITELVGAVLPSSTLFFFGLVFALLMLLHFSVRISLLERRVTLLVQELGLLSADRLARPPDQDTLEALAPGSVPGEDHEQWEAAVPVVRGPIGSD
jgi:hypothetical protein